MSEPANQKDKAKSCDGKIRHESRQAAAAHSNKLHNKRGDNVIPYYCYYCNHWHVGHVLKR